MTTNGHKPGFRIPERTARLVFEGDYEGAEVVVRLDVPLQIYIDIAKRFQFAADGAEGDPAEVMEAMETVLTDFSRDVLREWNVEDAEGNVIPSYPAGMLGIPLDMTMLIITNWMEAASASPLAQTNSGPSTRSAKGGARRPAPSLAKKRG